MTECRIVQKKQIVADTDLVTILEKMEEISKRNIERQNNEAPVYNLLPSPFDDYPC